jgi:hypothetical protein
MPIKVKSVSGTRTMAVVRGSGVHSKDRHVKAFQIASLELERTRRVRELKAARDRIATLGEHLREVDETIARYQRELRLPDGAPDESHAPPPTKRTRVRYG